MPSPMRSDGYSLRICLIRAIASSTACSVTTRWAASTAFHMQDGRGPTLATDEADGLALGHDIVDLDLKLCEAPKYRVKFVVRNDQQRAVAFERGGKHDSSTDRSCYWLAWRGRIRGLDFGSGAG